MECDHLFWQWARLCVDTEEYPEQAEDLLQSRMISLVPEIWISSSTRQNILDSLLVFISEGNTIRLKKLCLVSNGDAEFVQKIATDILAGAALQLETLQAKLTGPQLEAVLVRLANTED